MFEFVYYNCTLVEAIGVYPAGSCLDQISIDFEFGSLSAWNNDGKNLFTVNLELTVKS